MRIYKGKIVELFKEKVKLPNGKTADWEIVKLKDVAIILPLVDKDTILMIKQYRAVVKDYLYELPAGVIDRGEDPKKRAALELEEETGFYSKDIKYMTKYYQSPGTGKRVIHFFVAKNLKKGKLDLGEHEIIETKRVKLKKAIEMVRKGKILNGDAAQGILYYKAFYS